MKKSNFDSSKKLLHGNQLLVNECNKNKNKEFSIEKLKKLPNDIIELLKIIQAIRYDKIRLQEEYNNYRLKLNNNIMNLASEVIKFKKKYNTKICILQEQYNSIKSNNNIELTKIRSKS